MGRKYTISGTSRGASQENVQKAIQAITKHGEASPETPEYMVWKAMIQRCTNPSHKDYMRYGGRGIFVRERWMDYAAFIADMGHRPSPQHTIERNDNDGPYSPENCCWATRIEQSANMKRTRMITFNGKTMSLRQWAIQSGVNYHTLFSRIESGLDFESAIKVKP